MKCPNGNPEFYGMFDAIAGNHRPDTRRCLYYGMCIPLRLLLLLILFRFAHTQWMWFLVMVGSAWTLYRKVPGMCTEMPQWWSQSFQVVIALAMLGSAIAVCSGKLTPQILPLLWLVSIVGGLAQSVVYPIC